MTTPPPAGPPPGTPTPEQEERVLAAILPPDLAEKLAELDAGLLTDWRDAAREWRRLRSAGTILEQNTTRAKQRYLELATKAKEKGVEALPLLDPITGLPVYAYVRADPETIINTQDFREAYFEYRKVRLNEDDETALAALQDILAKLLKPEVFSVTVFKELNAKGEIPDEVAAACTTIRLKAAYPAFERPKR